MVVPYLATGGRFGWLGMAGIFLMWMVAPVNGANSLSPLIELSDLAARSAAIPAAWHPQEDADAVQQVQEDEKQEAEKQEKETDDRPIIDTASDSDAESDVDPREVRFHMWDGSVVSGKVAVEAINVETEFGMLQVPIDRIVQFYPGLNTLTELNQQIQGWVEQLGSRNFDEREAAHRELSSRGSQLQKLIDRFDDGGSAERKKHLDQIRQEILEQQDSFDLVGDGNRPPLVMGDTIETPDFTIVGQIQESSFQIETKYGQLEVRLSDIQQGERQFGNRRTAVRANVEIPATAFWQTDPVSTRIRVNRGDRIIIMASGNVLWQNWGNLTSTPDGIGNQGQWRGIQSGTLIARVGNGNNPIKIGSSGEFVAKSSGILQLCIAMQDNYASNEGYRWDGGYKARVVVEPAGR